MRKFLSKAMGCAVLLLALAGGVAAQQSEIPVYVGMTHRTVLREWLARNPQMRVATDNDCGKCMVEIESQSRANGAVYHPYYAVGDFNGDGKEDFAVALIESKAVKKRLYEKFAVAVFNGPFKGRGRSRTPAFLRGDLNLRDGGLFFGPTTPQPNKLFIGLFGSDQGLTLVPEGKKYVGQ
jgi:hypothetical protein